MLTIPGFLTLTEWVTTLCTRLRPLKALLFVAGEGPAAFPGSIPRAGLLLSHGLQDTHSGVFN